MPLPQLTAEDRANALTKATAVRRDRALLKENLKKGRTDVATIVARAATDDIAGKNEGHRSPRITAGLREGPRQGRHGRSRHRQKPTDPRPRAKPTGSPIGPVRLTEHRAVI